MRIVVVILVLGLLLAGVVVWHNVRESEARDAKTNFRHRRSRLVAKLGSPRHTAADVISSPGEPATVEGKFAYSDASKDLEDEFVSCEVLAGERWVVAGRALTDGDGRARVEIPASLLTGAQVRYRMTVEGDRTGAEAAVWVLDEGAAVAVFDIDGTLTPGDREIIKRTVWGSEVKVRPGGPGVVGHWASERRALPIYLTGRPYLYNEDTRRWLERHGFPPGPLLTPKSLRRAVPTDSGVGAFKQAELTILIERRKLDVVAAYGNAKTDVCAFARAGIAPERTYIFDDELEACRGYSKPHEIVDFRAHLAGFSAASVPR